MVRSSLFERLCCGAVAALFAACLAIPAPAAAKQVAVPTPKPVIAGETPAGEPAAPQPPAEPETPAASETEAAPEETPAAEVANHPASSIVVDVATGKVLSEHNATERRYPASTTKLMTVYLALKALREGTVSLDSPVIVTRLAAAQAPAKMGYPAGSVIRLDNAMKMMLVKSANDIAMAIGQSLAHESEEGFVDMMNAEAARLGMKDTHFVNPNGLPQDGQHSSAKDLAILAIQIRREFPAFSGYFDIEAITNGKYVMKNGNKLLGRFEGADGMKTGYICASGFNLVSSATRDGRTLVAVVLGANGTIKRERLSAAILQAGFETDLATKTQTVDQLPTSPGEVIDISDYICGAKGRSARAAERDEEKDRDEKFGSPYLTEMQRPPVTVKVGLGGAAGNELVDAGVSIIANYGIPIPTPRPTPPAPESIATDGSAPDGAATPAEPGEASVDTPLPAAETPLDKPSAANAYTSGTLRSSFPLGVHSPMAKRGPRLDAEPGFDLRAAGFGRQPAAAEEGGN